MDKKQRKALNFDLDTGLLKLNYPKKDYRQAYRDIKRFLLNNGFKHRQFSGYTSVQPLHDADLVVLVDRLHMEFPWLSKCVRQFDATNIGRTYDLTPAFAQALAVEKQTTCPTIPPRPSLMARLEAAKENVKERDAQKQPSAPEKPLKPKKREPER